MINYGGTTEVDISYDISAIIKSLKQIVTDLNIEIKDLNKKILDEMNR